MVLGSKSVQKIHLFSWREYIEYFKSTGKSDWLSVLKIALEIYNGDLKGYHGVPDEKEIREKRLKDAMRDLVSQSISDQINKLNTRSRAPVPQRDYEADSIAIKVAIEFCLNINSVKFLFDRILALFDQNGMRNKFIKNLEPFIMSGQFRNEFIPEDILKEFL